MCPECATRLEVTLTAEQWNSPPPSCPTCDAREMQQEFHPPAIGGSVRARAAAIAEGIIATDYQVADFKPDNRQGGTPKIRYKDQAPNLPAASWQAAQAQLAQAIDVGRAQRRTRYSDGPQGNALDVLQGALKTGEQPDLIAASKRRAIKVW